MDTTTAVEPQTPGSKEEMARENMDREKVGGTVSGRPDAARVERLLTDLMKALVDRPRALHITAVHGQETTMFEVHVGKRDYGKVLGKNGKTIEAARELLACLAGGTKRFYLLEIASLESEPSDDTEPEAAEALMPTIHSLLEPLLQAMVDQPEALLVTPLTGIKGAVFEVRAAPRDVRKLIGVQGRTAMALRRLIQAMGARQKGRFDLNILG